MKENPNHVVIPWELAVSLDETLDMDLRMASIYDGDDIDGSGVDYGDEAEGILEDRKALRKAMAKAMEDELTPDLFNQNGIVWHPYPKEKPKKHDLYIVTFKEGGDDPMFEPYVGAEVYVKSIEEFACPFPEHIVAWAEKPKPYRPEAKDEDYRINK